MNRLIENFKNKKVLVTGGSGFIGKSLVSRLRKLCHNLCIYEKDVRGISNYKKRYEIVCHLAALNKLGGAADDLRDMFDVNVNGTISVMRYCRRNDAKCILASSSAVYAPLVRNKTLPEDSPLKPVSVYGVSKMLAEAVCRSYGEDFGIRVMALRMFNIYGPGQKEPFLLPYLFNHVRKGMAVELKTPAAVRDFIDISDVVDAFILACGCTWKGFMALNVGTGRGVSVREMTRKIARLTQTKPIFNNNRITDLRPDYVVADVSNTIKILNWRPSLDLEKRLAFFMHNQ